MQIGARYYHPPFPNQQFWKTDLKQMCAAGLNTIQLWVLSWLEAKPSQLLFDDYDELMQEAQRNDLQVVLSVIPEVQPH